MSKSRTKRSERNGRRRRGWGDEETVIMEYIETRYILTRHVPVEGGCYHHGEQDGGRWWLKES